MENLITSLEENLKDLYRKAIDADNKLIELKKQGHGKFEAVFKDSKLFATKANKFMPYLEETAEDVLKLKEKDQADQQNIETIVKKLHLLHTTIGNFINSLK